MAYGLTTVQEFTVDGVVRSRLTHELIDATYEDIVAVQDRSINGVIDCGKIAAATLHGSQQYAAYKLDAEDAKPAKKKS